ncbi:hypothetical protein I6N90_05955 [Paenibacillus sp. GSMTC-2017]|nr:hypothetical protein [Paenibacillus sp. GSMTC-2017]
MKKMLFLLLIMLFSFSASASANPPISSETWYVASSTAGQRHLTVDVYNVGTSNISITLYKEGPSGQWTEVFKDYENLWSSQLYTLNYSLGYLASGSYKVVLDVYSQSVSIGHRLDYVNFY